MAKILSTKRQQQKTAVLMLFLCEKRPNNGQNMHSFIHLRQAFCPLENKGVIVVSLQTTYLQR
jgi:hypothetical protein